jgi:hypothetical protein
MENREVIDTIKNGHIAEGLLSYAMFNGATSISMKEGLWVRKVDEHWIVKCNGKDHDVENIPPFSWSIEFNGWPAGIMSIMGDGILCAGEAGNEENLRKALLDSVNQKILKP